MVIGAGPLRPAIQCLAGLGPHPADHWRTDRGGRGLHLGLQPIGLELLLLGQAASLLVVSHLPVKLVDLGLALIARRELFDLS
jgi:hypothetical protein